MRSAGGKVTQETLTFMEQLSRESDIAPDSVRLFATNLEADSYNVDKMLQVGDNRLCYVINK